MSCLFGIDIGGTSIKIGLFDEKFDLIKKYEIKTNLNNNGKFIIKEIVNSLKTTLLEFNYKKEDLKGIGVGIPGAVINNKVEICVNLGWKNIDVEANFLNELGFKTKIIVKNDANLAAIGEMCKIGANCKNALMLTLGTGVGAGIIANGEIVDGFNGAGGEIGHAKVDFKYNFKCNCGKIGCLETVASATGIVNIAKKKLEKKHSSLDFKKELNAKIIFDEAIKGDEVSLDVIEEVCHYLGYTCSLYAVATNPEIIIIGGGVSKSGDILIKGITKYYQNYAFSVCRNTKIVLATLGNDAGIYGGAYLFK